MIRIITFTKQRQLQFQAYLESFYFYTNAYDMINHTIIANSAKDLSDEIYIKFPQCIVYFEEDFGSFDTIIRYIVKDENLNDEDIILFAVDDLIWHRVFNLNILNELNKDQNKDTLGFSLRLGKNILPYDPQWNESKNNLFIKLDWRSKPSHYGYPFSVSSDAYRASLFKEIVNHSDEPFRLPNDLEGRGCIYCWHNKVDQPKMMMMNDISYSSCLPLNRVQDLYQNPVKGNIEHNWKYLSELYNNGYRLNWKKIFNIQPKDCFLDLSFYDIIRDE